MFRKLNSFQNSKTWLQCTLVFDCVFRKGEMILTKRNSFWPRKRKFLWQFFVAIFAEMTWPKVLRSSPWARGLFLYIDFVTFWLFRQSVCFCCFALIYKFSGYWFASKFCNVLSFHTNWTLPDYFPLIESLCASNNRFTCFEIIWSISYEKFTCHWGFWLCSELSSYNFITYYLIA